MPSWNLVHNFEKSKATNLILALLETGSMNFTELMKATQSNPRTLSDRIKDLNNAKIITVVKLQKFPFTETIKLTSNGEEIAKKMKRVYSTSEKRAKELLFIINEAGGKIIGTTRLEKLPFLLDKEYGVKFSYGYLPMTYGPYSLDLLDDIEILVKNDYLEVNEEVVPVTDDEGVKIETIRRSYFVTEQGRNYCIKHREQMLPKFKVAIDFISNYNNITLASLLDLVHEKYPEYRKKNNLK